MTSFEPIHYTYVPTAPRSKRAIVQMHSFPLEEQQIVPDRRLFGDAQRTKDGDDSGSEPQENSDKENTADDDHNIDLPTSSISQASIGEDSSLENRICENKIASPGIHNDDDSSSIETVLDPRLYPEALKEESQRGYNIQGTLEDDKSNPNEQENFKTRSSYSSSSDYSFEQSHPLTTCSRDQSGSGYGDPEELEHGSSPYFLQQHEDIAVGSIEEENNKQQGRRKRRYLPETEIIGDSESDDDTRPAKQQRTRSFSTNNKQTQSQRNIPEGCLQLRRIPSPIFTAPSPIIDSSRSSFGGNSPAPSDSNHCHSTQSPPTSSLVEPAPTAEYQEWPFQGFLKRTRIGNNATYNLEFRLQDVPEQLHLPILSEVLGVDTFAEASSPLNMVHSKLHSARSQAKRKHVPWELKEHETILRMKKDGCSWEEIHHALPHRTQAAIQVHYSTKLKK